MLHRFGCLLVLVLMSPGCGNQESPAAAEAQAAAAAGVANPNQIKYFIVEKMKLTRLDLVSMGSGDYSGVGTTSDGTESFITITQVPGQIQYSWENSNGKEGNGVVDVSIPGK